MVHSIQRDKRRRLLVYKYMIKRTQYKTVLQDSHLSHFIKKRSFYKYAQLCKNSSITRVKNRCILTARGRGVLRFCKLSRISVRKLASQTLLMGIIKASW